MNVVLDYFGDISWNNRKVFTFLCKENVDESDEFYVDLVEQIYAV